jgi:PIN domain nuclease of toxin-antitoxin system
MAIPLLLDTHTLVWMEEGSSRLGLSARRRIVEAYSSGDVFVSPISFWEAGIAARKGRLKLPATLLGWAQSVIEAGYVEAPITTRHAILAVELSWRHQDPADRILVSTAINEQLTLVTADRAILSWDGTLSRLNAEK